MPVTTGLMTLASASLQAVAGVMLHPALLLAPIAFFLGGSYQQIAWFAVINVASWALTPALLHALLWMTHRTDLVLLAALVVQAGTIVALGMVAYRLTQWEQSRSVSVLIGTYAILHVSGSMANQVGRGQGMASTPGRNPGRAIGWRNGAMLLAGVVAGWAAWSQFDAGLQPLESSKNLLILSTIALGGSVLLRLLIVSGRTVPRAPSALRLSRSIRFASTSPAIRRFISYRALLALVAAFDPFLLVYGFSRMQLEVRFVGVALLAWVIGQLAGQLLWPGMVDRRGARIPLQIAMLLRLMLLVPIVSLPELVTSSAYAERFDGPETAMTAFAMGFALLGLAASSGNAANRRYLMDVAPPEHMHGLTTVANSIAGILAFAPLGVAWALDTWEMDRVFWVAIALAVAALLASGLLPNARARARSLPGAWRRPETSQPI